MNPIKSLIDVLGAALLAVVLAPVFVVLLLLVRLKLGSPALYRAERIGKDGRHFTLYKFRSMTEARDASGELLPDELRVTRFGRFLRSSSLDELPGLWNVLRRDMSLIGPRPFSSLYDGMYTPLQNRRHEVLPGITGLAQVSGRNDLSWPEKFGYDLYYIDNWSLWLDMRILARTILKVAGRKGVDSNGHVSAPPFRGHEEGAEVRLPTEVTTR